MTEQITQLPPAPDEQLQQAMVEQFNAAQAAAADNETLQTYDLGTATSRVRHIETVGRPLSDGPYIREQSEVGNTPNDAGHVYSTRYDGHSNQGNYGDGTRTEFQFNAQGIEDRDTGRTEYARVARYDENGKVKYEHRFTDPKTAQKFGALIAKHAARREMTPGPSAAEGELKKAA